MSPPAISLQLPGGGQTTLLPTPVDGPFGAQIMALEVQHESVGEKLKKVTIDLDAATQTTQQTKQAWQAQTDLATRLRERANQAAADAYKKATRLGPFSDHVTDMHQLGLLAPGLNDGTQGGPAGSRGAADDATKAQMLEETAHQAYLAALDRQQQLTAQMTALNTSFLKLTSQLNDLKSKNKAQLDQSAKEQEQKDLQAAQQATKDLQGIAVNGQKANTLAIQALKFAFAQLGKPYVWGTEGPDTYDCSGLVLASYRSVGRSLPRVAADQYAATRNKSVDRHNLLPGDLLFFNPHSSTDWTSISHVGIYVGNDQMIEAPTTGQNVKVAPIWWSAFFGATRVFDAVPASNTSSSDSSGDDSSGDSSGGSSDGSSHGRRQPHPVPTTHPAPPTHPGAPPSKLPTPGTPPDTNNLTASPSTGPSPAPTEHPSAGASASPSAHPSAGASPSPSAHPSAGSSPPAPTPTPTDSVSSPSSSATPAYR